MTFTRFGLLASLSLLATATCLDNTAFAQAIDTGLFTQNRVRQCNTDSECIGGDPTLIVSSDYDLSVTGSVTTYVAIPELGAQGASSAGFDGLALAPAMSSYAYTDGPQRYTLGSWGFQKYTFLQAGQVTLSGSLTYDQTGQTFPSSQNPRGRVSASFMSFQFDDNEFDASDCNLFSSYSASNIAGTLNSCVRFHGSSPFGFPIEFTGLENLQIVDFLTGSEEVVDGMVDAELVVNGEAGDVFFLAANLGIQAHLGGFADTGNSLRIEIDNFEILEPAFDMASFEPAPARTINIDIKPGDEANCVNINGRGVIPVAIFGSEILDVTDIDFATLSFAGLSVRERKNGALCHFSNVDEDVVTDLVCKFEDDADKWSPGDGEAMLTGAKFDGSEFMGSDSICH